MSIQWDTQEYDLNIARKIIEKYAADREEVGLLQCVFNVKKKSLSYELADWIPMLAKEFMDEYGAEQGDFITRKVITYFITIGETMQ